MREQDGLGRALAWMATGAAVLMAGAFVGATAGRRKERSSGNTRAPEPDPPGDLEDRPVAQAAWADAMTAVRRVDTLVHTVSGLESRVAAVETTTRKIDDVWQRVLRLEQMLDELKRERAEPANVAALVAETERRVLPRVEAIESRLDHQDAALQQLQSHAAQTDLNLQRMILAVEKLTEQISRALPAGPVRIEPKRETESETGSAEERGGLSRWRSVAIIGAVALSLAGSYAGVRQIQRPPQVSAAPAQVAPDRHLDTAIASLAALSDRDPANLTWRYELGRLNELKGNRIDAERWYRSILEVNPQDPRAAAALADLLSR
jgi:tetratricopeptide (TPR) repeat protein